MSVPITPFDDIPSPCPVKTYVAVDAEFLADGTLLPVSIIWEDGRKYNIDKVLKIRSAASSKAGGQGDRYTILINGFEKHLFFERGTKLSGNNIGRWFVERTV